MQLFVRVDCRHMMVDVSRFSDFFLPTIVWPIRQSLDLGPLAGRIGLQIARIQKKRSQDYSHERFQMIFAEYSSSAIGIIVFFGKLKWK